jgi:4-amino-4-deoxy-L-arabinose transferase-like glycosyltransferase
MNIRNSNLWLILIISFAFVLRIVGLTYNPPSLNWDEISHGYNAYSVMTSGMDEWGQRFPIANFRAYGDYPLPLNLYLTIPSIATFGLTEFAIRFPHVILGVLSVIATYFLALGLTKRKDIGLITSLLIAIDPWTLFTSRFVLQSNLSIFFLITALAFFFNREKWRWNVPLTFLSLGLTLFSYHSTRIVTPILVVALFVVYRKELFTFFKKKTIHSNLSVIILLLFFIPLPFILLNPNARARSKEVFILNDAAVYSIESSRNESTLPQFVSKLVYNRPIYFFKEFAGNYLEYFSPTFLFKSGGTQYQFSLPNHGLLYWVELPFFYLGLCLLLLYFAYGKKDYQFLLLWFLIGIVPAAITKEHYAVLRSTGVLPIPEILVAMGLFTFIDWFHKRGNNRINVRNHIIFLFVICLCISLARYLYLYNTSYRDTYSSSWQYGYKEAVFYAKDHYRDYDQIIVTKKYGEPHEFFLFFGGELNAQWGWQPTTYMKDSNLVRYSQSDWFWVDRFDKFYFMNDWQMQDTITEEKFTTERKEIVDCSDKKCLLITSPAGYPPPWKKIDTIKFLDGVTAFELYEN